MQLDIALTFAEKIRYAKLDGQMFRIYGALAAIRCTQDAVISIWRVLDCDKQAKLCSTEKFKGIRDLCHFGGLHAARADQLRTTSGKKRGSVSSFISFSDCGEDTATVIVSEMNQKGKRVTITISDLINQNSMMIDEQLELIEDRMDEKEGVFRSEIKYAVGEIGGWKNYSYNRAKLSINVENASDKAVGNKFYCNILRQMFADLNKVLEKYKFEPHFREDFQLVDRGFSFYNELIDAHSYKEAYIVYCGVKTIADSIVASVKEFIDGGPEGEAELSGARFAIHE